MIAPPPPSVSALPTLHVRSHFYCCSYAMKPDGRRANHIIVEKSWPNSTETLIISVELQPNASSTWIRAASSYYIFNFHRIAATNRDLLSDWLSSFRVFSSFSQVMFIIRSTNVFLLWVLLCLLKYWCLSIPARKCLNWSILHVIVEQFFINHAYYVECFS